MLFVSDLHYALKQFDWLAANAGHYQAVVIGGDLLDMASALDIDVQAVVIEKYLNRLSKLTNVVASSGNHDGDSRNTGNEAVANWLQDARAPQLFVDGDSVELAGALITVCPWWDGPILRSQVEEQLARDAAKQKSKWIWIHHNPPDHSRVSWTGRKFGGDEVLVEWIARYQPDLVLSGHIHNAPFYSGGSWIDRVGKTWIFNPGRQIGPCPAYLAFDLEKSTVTWISLEGDETRELLSLDVPAINAPSADAGVA